MVVGTVYVYILSMARDRVRVENIPYNPGTYMARRWTAIGMGADRDQTAIGPLSSAGDPTFYKGAHFFVRTHSHATFLYQRVSHDSFCTSAGIHDHYPIHRLPHRPPIYPVDPGRPCVHRGVRTLHWVRGSRYRRHPRHRARGKATVNGRPFVCNWLIN